MMADILSRDLLASRTPSELATYLGATGWRRIGEYAGARVWTIRSDGDEFEALLPVDGSVRDYGARIADLLEVLSTVEGRAELDIWRDLSTVDMDVQYIRTFPDTPSGTTPIDDGVAAFEGARNLLAAVAVAVATDMAQAVQSGRKPAAVSRFLRGVRIGPTSVGSFVLSVLTPVPAPLVPEQPLLPAAENKDDAETKAETKDKAKAKATSRRQPC